MFNYVPIYEIHSQSEIQTKQKKTDTTHQNAQICVHTTFRQNVADV